MATQLNENETKVLKALQIEEKLCSGGEFGYLPDVDRVGFSKHEFAGYIGSLTKKNVFEYIDTDSGEEYEGQYSLNQEFKGV